jgi:predicted RNA-binding Zn-ribbon protein involved in translation (DUF1610 family)
MSFVQPRKVFVDVKGYLESLLPNGLEKDLHEDEDYIEEVCETCHGAGFAKSDNRYGLTDHHGRVAFPFKHESLWWCPDCYNGIVYRCKHCGKLLPKGHLKCDCETIKERERVAGAKKLQEAWDKAEELGPEALGDRFGMCCLDDYGYRDGYFDDWDEFFETWENQDEGTPRPTHVWGTDTVEMHIDAGDVVDNATEELYEDAGSEIGKKTMKELQDFLNDWCGRCGVGKTYMESHEFKVRIPWEDYDKESKRA